MNTTAKKSPRILGFLIITLIFIPARLISHNNDAWSSGGGDPIIVQSYPFPNSHILSAAISLLKARVNASIYPESFKVAYLADINSLQDKNAFFYIPELFAVGFQRYAGDYTKLVSNGAMTEFQPASPIYFSKQAASYDAETLAQVIAQEIPHHIFKDRFQRNEEFANNLGTHLVKGGEMPTSPFPAGHIIYEQFVNVFMRASTVHIIDTAKADLAADRPLLPVIYDLAHDLYRDIGDYWNYNIDYAFTNQNRLAAEFPKALIINNFRQLREFALKSCLFVKYTDKTAEISPHEQQVLLTTFEKILQQAQAKWKNLYYIEGFSLRPHEQQLTACGFAVEDFAGDIFVMQAVYGMTHPDFESLEGKIPGN